MPQLIKVQYKKQGAVFSDGNSAFADRNSAMSAEIFEPAVSADARLLEEGILLSPIYFTWDQENFILTVHKLVSSFNEYNSNRNIVFDPIMEKIIEAGWVMHEVIVEDQV